MIESAEIKRLSKNLTTGLLWVYILSILRKKDFHAYALRNEVSKRFGFLPGNVTAYVVLYKLESRAFVKSKQRENKKIYSITKNGVNLLKEAQKTFKDFQKKLF